MILSFEVVNYRSIYEAATLFFTKRTLTTNHPKDGNWNAVTERAIGLFGANAAGKSNFIRAIQQLCTVMLRSLGNEMAVRELHDPHRLHTDEPVEFELDFVAGEARYRWSLCIGYEGILSENVEFNTSRQWRPLLKRSGDKVQFGPSAGVSSTTRAFVEEAVGPWVSAVAAWMQAKTTSEHSKAFSSFANSVRSSSLPPEMGRPTQEFVVNLLSSPVSRELSGPVLEMADVGVSEATVEEYDVPPQLMELRERLAELFRDRKEDGDVLSDAFPDKEKTLSFSHKSEGKEFSLSLVDESVGTVNWLMTVVPALYVVFRGGVLIIDELDSSLHPFLTRQLVSIFTNEVVNTTGAQILFTAHDVTLLGNYPVPVLEPSAAWLVEKNDGRSVVASLDEFNLRGTNNAEKRYMQGVFGAVPQLEAVEYSRAFRDVVNIFHEVRESIARKESSKMQSQDNEE